MPYLWSKTKWSKINNLSGAFLYSVFSRFRQAKFDNGGSILIKRKPIFATAQAAFKNDLDYKMVKLRLASNDLNLDLVPGILSRHSAKVLKLFQNKKYFLDFVDIWPLKKVYRFVH